MPISNEELQHYNDQLDAIIRIMTKKVVFKLPEFQSLPNQDLAAFEAGVTWIGKQYTDDNDLRSCRPMEEALTRGLLNSEATAFTAGACWLIENLEAHYGK